MQDTCYLECWLAFWSFCCVNVVMDSSRLSEKPLQQKRVLSRSDWFRDERDKGLVLYMCHSGYVVLELELISIRRTSSSFLLVMKRMRHVRI